MVQNYSTSWTPQVKFYLGLFSHKEIPLSGYTAWPYEDLCWPKQTHNQLQEFNHGIWLLIVLKKQTKNPHLK